MTKQQILDLERVNTDKIVLFLEGPFLTAYEHSAFLFATQVKPYKVTKKFVKSIGCEIASLGFPLSLFNMLVKELKLDLIEQIDNQVVIRSPQPLVVEDFEVWKSALEIYTPASKKPVEPEATSLPEPESEPDFEPEPDLKPLPPPPPSPPPVSESSVGTTHEHIIDRIRKFRLEISTPLDCLNFVAELKQQVAL
jgi:hypothetical protein